MKSKKQGTLKRVIKMLFEFYPVLMPLVVVCVLLNAVVSSIPAIFMQNIIALVEQSWQSGDWAAVSGNWEICRNFGNALCSFLAAGGSLLLK